MSTSADHIPITLLDLLANTLILHHTVPYLPVSALLSLGGTSKAFQALIYKTPGVFRHLDLSTALGAAIAFAPIDAGGEIWRNERMDEAVTEDDFYSGPLRGVFSNLRRKNKLQDVQTLILDGLSVPADLVWEIMGEDQYRVRILSIRDAKNLNEKKLMQVLRYCVRPSRQEGMPKLKGLYVLGPRDSSSLEAGRILPEKRALYHTGVTSSEGAQLGMEWNNRSHQALSSALAADGDRWYQPWGRMIPRHPVTEWAETIQACEGLIAFDAVLCRGPRHSVPQDPMPAELFDVPESATARCLSPAIATVALGAGCAICHTSPEGPASFPESAPAQLPLLAPVLRHSSTVRAAQRPSTASTASQPVKLFVRCEKCLENRWCERCNRWWCESCYDNKANHSRRFRPPSPQAADSDVAGGHTAPGSVEPTRPAHVLKVHLGLCTERCLVSEMMAGAGSGGMWG